MRQRIKEDLFRRSIEMLVQIIALLCLIVIVYIIGRSVISPSSSAKKSDILDELTTAKEKEITKSDKVSANKTSAINTSKNTKNTTTSSDGRKNNSSIRNSRNTRMTTSATEETTQAEISTKYGPETNQDGNSAKWISEQKDVIDLEKDRYELRGKGKSGIQYIDPNGDVAKVLYQPADSIDGKSYEEYYYQGNELIYASIWRQEADGTGEQYYYNNGVLIQWVDENGLIYNKETKGKDFGASSKWEKYLSAGTKAMRKTEGVETATTLVEDTASTAKNASTSQRQATSATSSTSRTISSDSTVQ